MRRAMTPAEFRLWQALTNQQCYGMRFLRQRVIGQFILDFYCPRERIGIEVDSGVHNLIEVRCHDQAKDEGLLEDHGIVIVRFTNQEILCGTPESWYQRIHMARKVAGNRVSYPLEP